MRTSGMVLSCDDRPDTGEAAAQAAGTCICKHYRYMCICKQSSSRIERSVTMAGQSNKQKSLCNCTALRKATRRVSQLYDSALEPCGLRTTQRAILNQIARTDTPALGELAEVLVMDRGA